MMTMSDANITPLISGPMEVFTTIVEAGEMGEGEPLVVVSVPTTAVIVSNASVGSSIYTTLVTWLDTIITPLFPV